MTETRGMCGPSNTRRTGGLVSSAGIQNISTDHGGLLVYETSSDFTTRRFYLLTDNQEGFLRGDHALKSCNQWIIHVQGSALLHVDTGASRRNFKLAAPGDEFFLPAGVWRKITIIEDGTVLLVICDEKYDPDDYLADYDSFLRWIKDRDTPKST